jgi:hypothetical protein
MVERYEALGVPAGIEDAPSVLDPDHLVSRSMEDEQRPVQVVDLCTEILRTHVLQELTADGEPPSGKLNRRLARALDSGHFGLEACNHVFRIGRCCDRHHRLYVRQVAGGREYRRAAERVTDQKLGRPMMLCEIVGGAAEVLDVGGEVRVGELATRGAEAREVEAQDGNAAQGEF